MALFDTAIRGGILVDGRRMPRVRADVGIKNGKIAAIGAVRASDADRVLDASGMIVAPGFIDLHTHYDAQIFWDPYCSMAGWHGVTSLVFLAHPNEPERAAREAREVLKLILQGLRSG